MTPFSLPEFAKLSARIARAERELSLMQQYFQSHASEVEAGDWGAVSAISAGIHNVYNGIEDILHSIARDVDDYVPSGASAHQDILDQMAAEIAGTRPALLDPALYDGLFELKNFRHMVRHKYGIDLRPDRVMENLDLLNRIFPRFIQAVVTLEQAMRRQDGPSNG